MRALGSEYLRSCSVWKLPNQYCSYVSSPLQMDFFALASSSMLYGKVRAFWINLWIYSYFLRLNLLRLCCYCPKKENISHSYIKLPNSYLLNPFEITMSKDMIWVKTKLWAKRQKLSFFIITCNSTCTCTKLHSLLKQGLQDLCLTQKSGNSTKPFNLTTTDISWKVESTSFLYQTKIVQKPVLKTNGL